MTINVNWKDAAHYGVAGLALALSGLAYMGIHIPGVSVDPSVSGAFGVGVFAAGFKGGARVASAIAAMAALTWSLAATPVYAADLAVKAAPPVTGCTLTDCNGFYFGANMLEQGGNFDLIGGGLNGLAQNNFSMGLQAGYEIYNGQWRLGLEVGADYGISQVGALPGGGNAKLWSADGLACIGYTLAPLFGASATASSSSTTPLPSIPAALANALMSPCVLVGAWQRPWGIGFASGARASALIAKNWTVDIDYIHVNYNNANINPIVQEQTENIVRAGINYHF